VAIRTFAELAPTRLDDPEFRDSFLRVAQSEIGRLEELVSQFMTLARPSKAVREAMDIPAMIDRGVNAISVHAQNHRVNLRADITHDVPHLRGDEARLYQALQNLLLNAVDATPADGDVVISASMLDDHTGQHGVAVTVWNSGSYIPPEDRERVFEPFFTSKPAGTGLGLALCHTIIDEHGGTTTVESDLQDGTAFTIWLPVTSYHETAAASAP
jgi:signal transduction histidine kinase